MTQDEEIRIWPLADHGLLCEFGNAIEIELSGQISRLAEAMRESRIADMVDAIPAYTTLLLITRPGTIELPSIIATMRGLWREISAQPAVASNREITIPVVYGGAEGPDLLDVARSLGIAPEELVDKHTSVRYRVGTIGFAPGFAYLIGLPPELTTPRRPSPRVRVPVGSVGIGGAQTGIYSCPTPGGWSLIGRTAISLFDLTHQPPAILAVGDTVRFDAVSRHATMLRSHDREPRDPGHLASIEIVAPGLMTTVQDLGRPGYGYMGVAPGGAADRSALIRGNRLVGNPGDAAALEMTIIGPQLRFLRPGRIVIVGANLNSRLNDIPLPNEAVRIVRPGDTLTCHTTPRVGARAYLCITGGIDVPRHLGSRSTDLVGEFGGYLGRQLRAGDRLRVGFAPGPWHPTHPAPAAQSAGPIRITRGPQADRFDPDAWFTLLDQTFTVSEHANRQGIRLDGPLIPLIPGKEMISQGVITGAVQITGAFQPIIMLPAHATIGGYPHIATVLAADLDRLGQLKPGDTVRFELGELPEVPIPPVSSRPIEKI